MLLRGNRAPGFVSARCLLSSKLLFVAFQVLSEHGVTRQPCEKFVPAVLCVNYRTILVVWAIVFLQWRLSSSPGSLVSPYPKESRFHPTLAMATFSPEVSQQATAVLSGCCPAQSCPALWLAVTDDKPSKPSRKSVSRFLDCVFFFSCYFCLGPVVAAQIHNCSACTG